MSRRTTCLRVRHEWEVKAWQEGFGEWNLCPLNVSTQDVVMTVEVVVASSSFGQLEEDSLEHRVHGRSQNEAQSKSGCQESQSIGDKWREDP